MELQLRPPNLPLSQLDLENLRVWRFQALEGIMEIPFSSTDPGNYAQQIAFLRGQLSIIDALTQPYIEEQENEHAPNSLN